MVQYLIINVGFFLLFSAAAGRVQGIEQSKVVV